MTPCTRCTTFIILIIFMALPAWGQQYFLYSPQPVATSQKIPSQDGIIVQEVEIQKGDTLYDLSRKFSGHGMYYPQILLFNSIKNPDLIYTGDTLKIPVARTEVHDSDRSDTKPTGTTHKPKTSGNRKTVVHVKENRPNESPTETSPSSPSPATHGNSASDASGQKLFDAALKAYRQDDCRTALELLDSYLAGNSGSPLAADANLYKADCYLKLSAQ